MNFLRHNSSRKITRHLTIRLQEIMEIENVKVSGPEFEAKLAANIHPFMYSYPEPLGDRYRDVQSDFIWCWILNCAFLNIFKQIWHKTISLTFSYRTVILCCLLGKSFVVICNADSSRRKWSDLSTGLLDELADKSTTRGIQHQRYLETVLQFKDKGYRFVLPSFRLCLNFFMFGISVVRVYHRW